MPELGGAQGIDPIAHRDDGIQVGKIDVASDFPTAFGSNCPELPDSCLALDLADFTDVFQVLADGADSYRKELGHQFLCQPDGFVLAACFDALLTCQAGKYQELGSAVADQFF